jgi:hypothetical protein
VAFEEFNPMYIDSQQKVYDSIMGPDAFEEIIRKFARRVWLRSLRETIHGYAASPVDLFNLALCDAWHVVFSMKHVRPLA